MPSTLMSHDYDPKKAILDRVGDLSNITVIGSDVLCATYIRPEKTASGLILPDNIRDEDKFQGKCFLVIKCGPCAFKDENDEKFRDISEGDWVVARASDGLACLLNSQNTTSTSEGAVHCRIYQDISIRMKVSSPDIIY